MRHTAYVYETESRKVIATVSGDIADAVQKEAESRCDGDATALTYTPAFGTVDGLTMTDKTEEVTL